MTLIEKIKQSVEGATGMPFLYHAAGELNELIARCKSLPVAYSFLIDSGTIDDVNGRYHERVTLAVMFCDKTEFDFNAIENEEIIERMKVKAYKWLQSLRMSNTLRIVSVNNTQRLYDNTTDILTGFAVNITIEDVAGVGECELPEVVIDVDKNGSYNVVGVDKVRVNVMPKLEELEVTQNGEYLPPTDIEGFSKVSVDVQPVLEELTITQDGTYTPQEGVDGFSKVTAEFDTSNLPKVKMAGTIRVTNDCIDVNGRWNGEQIIDMSLITTFSQSLFYICTNLKVVNLNGWNVSNIVNMNRAFSRVSCEYLDFSSWNTDSLVDTQWMFSGCNSTRIMNFTNWRCHNLTTNIGMFNACLSLISLVGGMNINEVIINNVSIMNGLSMSSDMFLPNTIDRASLRALINGLADLTGQTAQTLTLGATLIAKLTEEDIAIATNKNWTIV